MITMNINKMSNKVVFTIPLTADCNLMGLLEPLSAEPKDIDTINLVDDFVTGETTSKLSYIKRSFPAGQFKLNERVVLRGTDIIAVVTKNDPEHQEYIMYLNKEDINPNEPFEDVGYKFPSIMYTDKDGVTTFKYKVPKETGYPTDTAFILKHWGIIDEPKLDTNLFIDRGINNVFESFKRLKTVNNLQELQKTGFGFFNLYSKGVI